MNSRGVCCDVCKMDDEHCVFPLYGLAPHNHNREKTGGSFIGSTEIKDKSTWPENFTEDPEAKGCGSYDYCLKCAALDPELTLSEQSHYCKKLGIENPNA